MTLVKFNNEKNGVRNYSPFNDLFDSFFRDSYYNDSTLNKVPAVNIFEAEEAYTIEVAAPGLKKENFKPYRLPMDYSFSRKPPFQYGWDWAPRLVTCGIYNNVYLRVFEKGRIQNIHVTNDNIDIF